MPSTRQLTACLALTGLLVSSCSFQDLKKDLESTREDYGLFNARIASPDADANILVGLFKREQDDMSIANYRTIVPGESFYMLLPRADSTAIAFSDVNGDFVYQVGEPAARIEDPSSIGLATSISGKDLTTTICRLSNLNYQAVLLSNRSSIFR